MVKVNTRSLILFAVIIGLLLIGVMFVTNHFGIAIRLSNYYFVLIAIIAAYNLVSND